MADQRAITRAQTKRRVAAAKRTADEQAAARYARIAAALGNARAILADGTFIELVRAHGVVSLPLPLLMQGALNYGHENALMPGEEHLSDSALSFAIAWKFFAPLFEDPAVVIYLDTRW